MQTPEIHVAEVDRLRQITRDLIAISTLPAVWGGLHPEGVIKSLANVLLSTLQLDLVYIRMANSDGSDSIETICSKNHGTAEPLLFQVSEALDSLRAEFDANQAATIPDPSGDGTLRASLIRFGIAGGNGIVIAGSRRADFPSEHDRVLLGVGANQAAVVVQRQRAEQALQHSERRFLDFADTAPAMLWVTESDGSCSFLSRGWYEFTGQGKNEGLGFGWTAVVHPEDQEAARNAFLDANQQKREFSLEHRILHADGGYRWVIDTGRPRLSPAGEFMGFVGNVLDITHRRQTEEALRLSEEKHRTLFSDMAKSHKRLSEFLAVLAHELRNPLAPILTGLEMMRMRPDSPETVGRVREMIERQATQMVHLINDLLDMARVTNGKIEIRRKPVDLTSIISGAVETSLPAIEDAQHELSLRLCEKPLLLNADATRIAQVISNLLTNAAKYTPRGGKIRLSVEQDGDEAIISIIDNGIGVPAESLSTIFEMFSQVGRNMEHSQGGLGIGLALVRNLVSLHGGTVTAASEGAGKGSTFIVRLPLDLTNVHLSAEMKSSELTEPSGETLRILVADDNLDAAQSLASLLKMYGHNIQIARDGLQALQTAADFLPDLAFLDIGMPGMTGYEAARKLRLIDELKEMKIVAVTGWGAEEDRARSKDAGFDRHFIKPISPTAISDLLKEIPQLSNRTRHD